jgi:hypothetical protein
MIRFLKISLPKEFTMFRTFRIFLSLCLISTVSIAANPPFHPEDCPGADGNAVVSRVIPNGPAAGQYVVRGKIDGHGTLIMRDAVNVDLKEKTDGHGTVIIRNTTKVNFFAKIDGHAKVLIEAASLKFMEGAKIDGDALVLIIIPKNGGVEFKDKIDGDARVFWCKSSPDDPQPRPKTKEVNGNATFIEITRDAMDRKIKDNELDKQ